MQEQDQEMSELIDYEGIEEAVYVSDNDYIQEDYTEAIEASFLSTDRPVKQERTYKEERGYSIFEEHVSPSSIQTNSKKKNNNVKIITEKCKRWCCQEGELPPVYEDAFSVFGKFVADELKGLTNEFGKQKIKMEINKIIFEAATGTYDSPETDEPKTIPPIYLLQQISHQDKFDDYMTSFGKHIGNELRNIANTNARQVAKLKICTMLCEASIEDRITIQAENKIQFL